MGNRIIIKCFLLTVPRPRPAVLHLYPAQVAKVTVGGEAGLGAEGAVLGVQDVAPPNFMDFEI